jgi:hypothetical protein
MILSDKEILENIAKGLIVIEPFRPECLGSNSYDVHLGKVLGVYVDEVLDARKHNRIELFEIPEEGYVLQPNMLYLGVTEEYTDEQAFVEHVQQVRQAKILRQLLDRDISLLFEDPLENDMVLNMGPQHPATHGVLRVLRRLPRTSPTTSLSRTQTGSITSPRCPTTLPSP